VDEWMDYRMITVVSLYVQPFGRVDGSGGVQACEPAERWGVSGQVPADPVLLLVSSWDKVRYRSRMPASWTHAFKDMHIT
jgi:hypothetical protein